MYMYNVIHTVLPLLCPPFFQEKEGRWHNNEDLRFRLAVKPLPLPPIHVLRSTKLCCAVEDENSFHRHAVAVLKDGRVFSHVHVHVAICFANTAGSLADRLLPLAERLHSRMTCRIIGLRKPSEISEKGQDHAVLKLFSTRLIHEYNSSIHATRVHVQEQQYGSSGLREGACVMEVK